MSEQRVDAVELEEPEVIPSSMATLEEPEAPMTGDQMDAVIAVAGKMDAYSRAVDTIINAIIKRSYPGDWVCHANADDPEEKKKANIGAAAAERIATFLGIQERNWTMGAKEWSDDHKHFTYIYEADFTFGKRMIHAIGKAGTRDRFFGFAKGQWRALEDVQEDHIRTAAFRACRKEGVRALLGLRGIPLSKLKELGYDLGKIAYAGFEAKGKALDNDAKNVDKETGMAEKKITVMEIQPKEGVSAKTGKPWRLLNVRDTDGVIWMMWSAPGGKGSREAALVDSLKQKSTVTVNFQTEKTAKGEQYKIIKVNGEVEQ